jgi:hypothetical protein
MSSKADKPGLEGLAMEIIKQAVKDHKSSGYKQDAKRFFNGQWFETLCDFLGADPELIRQRLKQNKED